MTISEAKCELNIIKTYEHQLKALQLQITELRSRAETVKITNYASDGAHGGTFDKETELAGIIDKERELVLKLERKYYELKETTARIIDNITAIPHPYSEVLERRYVEGQRFEQIASEMYYSYYYVANKLVKQSLKKYAEIMTKKELSQKG